MSLERRTFAIDNTSLELYIYIDGENNPWFKAKEVAAFLGYKDTSDAIRTNVFEYNKISWFKMPGTTLHLEIPSNWQPNTIFINEPGLYQLMMRSKLPNMERFQRWVTSEVLPSIRKTGAYVSTAIESNKLDSLIDMLAEMKLTNSALLKEQIDVNKELSLKILNDKQKLAIIPDKSSLIHELRVFKLETHYIFIRAQRRNISKALKKIPNNYIEIFKKERIPNGINVLNKIKELIGHDKYEPYNNSITTKANVAELLNLIVY